jgi:TldD protein
MTKADAVEVSFEGGERSATRWANSSITVNLVQYDQQLTLNVRHGQKQGSSSTREFDDESLKAMVNAANDAAQKARDNPNLPQIVKGPQQYVKVDAVNQDTADFGPGQRAAWVKQSVEICEKKGVLGSGYIPKAYQTTCLANSEGLSFLEYAGASTLLIASSDLVGELVAQSQKGNPLTSVFKGLADVALGEAKRLGCSYADIRFTRSVSTPVNANGSNDRSAGAEGGGGFGGGRGGRGGGAGRARGGRPGAAGFGVRVIHSGVWGFASSPIVTEDEIKRITGLAADIAKASAVVKKVDVKLAPVSAYTEYWASPVRKEPGSIAQDVKQALVQKVVDTALRMQGVTSVNASIGITNEWKYFASSEGSYIEQETFEITPTFNVSAKVGDVTKTRAFVGVPRTGGWEVAEEAEMVENAERVAGEAIEMTTAKPLGMGLKDLVLMPSHAMLTIHEIVAHATELDRILGYEANYAGTSFVKLSDVRKLKYGSKLFNVTADRTMPGGMATIGFDDDGVKTTQFPIVRDGILAGLQTNRETTPLIGDKASKGCTSASSWRDYPFLRMPNVHVEPGPKGSPTPEQIIADTKDGVLIDGRGSYSIDQQRYNGQFGGNCFWEIKNGKKTRMVSDVTYNAITTDFWANLDAISDQESWRMYGTGGDAKGQPTQTNSISHGSPWLRIKKIMVGAAYA